jgi:hypothetical protein
LQSGYNYTSLITSVAINGDGSLAIVAIAGGSILRSENKGASWSKMNVDDSLSDGWQSIALSVDGSLIAAVEVVQRFFSIN